MTTNEKELIVETEKSVQTVHAPGTSTGTVNIKVVNLNCCDSTNCYVKYTHDLFHPLSPTPSEATNTDSLFL